MQVHFRRYGTVPAYCQVSRSIVSRLPAESCFQDKKYAEIQVKKLFPGEHRLAVGDEAVPSRVCP